MIDTTLKILQISPMPWKLGWRLSRNKDGARGGFYSSTGRSSRGDEFKEISRFNGPWWVIPIF